MQARLGLECENVLLIRRKPNHLCQLVSSFITVQLIDMIVYPLWCELCGIFCFLLKR